MTLAPEPQAHPIIGSFVHYQRHERSLKMRSMARLDGDLYITLRDSDGAVVRGMPDPFGGTFDASGGFDALVQEATSPMLAALDPDDETILASSDMAALAIEVDELLAAVPDRAKEYRGRAGTAWRALTRFRVMVSVCQADRRSTMHFLGD